MTRREAGLLGAGALVLAAFRWGFAAALPMTGDEAYFVLWGEHLAGGYYDHPPMVGWWLAGLLSFSRAAWFLRLPAVLAPLLLAWAGWRLARPYGCTRAVIAAWLILLLPANVWNVLITTDTPVIVFSMLSALAYAAALRRASLSLHALSGALLGLAFLGKYFAALLGIAYLAHVFFVRRDAGRFAGFALLLLAALPAPAYNLWWNSQHGWVNILFNFVNRNQAAGFSWEHPLLYLVSLLYLATPWLLYGLYRWRAEVRQRVRESPEAGAAFWLAAIPLALLTLLALWRSVGLHWLVSFIPLLAVLSAITLPEAWLARATKWTAALALVHIVLIAGLLLAPLSVWRGTRLGEGVALRFQADAIADRLSRYEGGPRFAMESYSAAASMAYASGKPFAVFGPGSFHARQDDFDTDWRALDGHDLVILRTRPPTPEQYLPFFDHVRFQDFALDGFSYYLVEGRGFRYLAYRDKVLSAVRERYYQIPAWLPQENCTFCARYFPAGSASRGLGGDGKEKGQSRVRAAKLDIPPSPVALFVPTAVGE